MAVLSGIFLPQTLTYTNNSYVLWLEPLIVVLHQLHANRQRMGRGEEEGEVSSTRNVQPCECTVDWESLIVKNISAVDKN